MSNTGTWMQRVAQDWLVLELAAGSGATALGITTGLQFLPFLLLTPFAGLVADRMPKQRLLQLTNLGMALPAAVLGILAVTGVAEVWHVYVLAFLLGSASAFDAPARQSFVSELVDPGDLTNAVGLNSASFNAARLVGPGLAGLLIAAFGGGSVATGWVILLNAVSYAAPIWSLRHLDASRIDAAAPADRGPGAIREGVAYVRARPDLLLVLGLVFFAGTFGLNFQITSALMATEVFGKGPEEFGLLGTFLAVGSLTGALLAARRNQVRHRLVVGAALAFGASVMLAGLMPSYLTFALLAPVTGLDRADLHHQRQHLHAAAHRRRGPRPGDGPLPDDLHGRHARRRAHHRLDRRGVRRTLDAAGRRAAHDRRCGALGGPLPPGRPGAARAWPPRARTGRPGGASGILILPWRTSSLNPRVWHVQTHAHAPEFAASHAAPRLATEFATGTRNNA